MQNYLDLKKNCLQKLGEGRQTTKNEITRTTVVKDYLISMPRLLSEALKLCSTAGKYIIKFLEIEQGASAGGYVRYDLKTLAKDFFSLKDREIFFEDSEGYGPYSDYAIEGERYFTVPADKAGKFRIYYNSYPQSIEDSIEDSTAIEVDPEVYAILPLYICGQIAIAEDEDYAMERLSEFEQRRAELQASSAKREPSIRVAYDSFRKAAL